MIAVISVKIMTPTIINVPEFLTIAVSSEVEFSPIVNTEKSSFGPSIY